MSCNRGALTNIPIALVGPHQPGAMSALLVTTGQEKMKTTSRTALYLRVGNLSGIHTHTPRRGSKIPQAPAKWTTKHESKCTKNHSIHLSLPYSMFTRPPSSVLVPPRSCADVGLFLHRGKSALQAIALHFVPSSDFEMKRLGAKLHAM